MNSQVKRCRGAKYMGGGGKFPGPSWAPPPTPEFPRARQSGRAPNPIPGFVWSLDDTDAIEYLIGRRWPVPSSLLPRGLGAGLRVPAPVTWATSPPPWVSPGFPKSHLSSVTKRHRRRAPQDIPGVLGTVRNDRKTKALFTVSHHSIRPKRRSK